MFEDENEINQVYSSLAQNYYAKRKEGTIDNTFIANPALRALIGNVKNKKILDAGCGFGEDMAYFLQKGADVVGVELNIELIKLAKQNPLLKNSVIKQGSIYKLGFKEEFDICIANLVLDQVKNLDIAFKEAYKLLKPNGVFVFSIAHPLNSATQNYTKQLEDYFTIKKGFFMPGSIGKEIPYYFRNINHYSDAIYKTGFVIERILEPRPIQAAQKKFKERYNLYSKVPDILIMKLRKPK